MDNSNKSEWSVIKVDDGASPWVTFRFRNGRGFEAEYRMDYREAYSSFREFPAEWVLKTLRNYDTWRDNEKTG